MSIFSDETDKDENLTAVVFSFVFGSSYRLWTICFVFMS